MMFAIKVLVFVVLYKNPPSPAEYADNTCS